MSNKNNWRKNKGTDSIWWLETADGGVLFSFDKEKTFNLFTDYPHKLTSEQKEIFDKENPEILNRDLWYKQEETDSIWWLETPDRVGEFLFSFDKKNIFNLFADYPHKLTSEQKEIFDKENPEWKDFFKDRQNDKGC